MKNVFLAISVGFSLWGLIIGLKSILKGRFKPQRMTRFLLFLIFVLIFASLLVQGDKNSIYIAFITMISTFLIFILSIKRGIGGFSIFDFGVLFATIIALVIWGLSNNPLLGLLMTLVAWSFAYVPTIIKSWIIPKTEDWFFYLVYVVASLFSILSIKEYTLANLAFPMYLIFANSLLVFIIIFRKNKV